MSQPIHFQGLGFCFYRQVRWGKPLRNEYYMANTVLEAYQAPTDLDFDAAILQPTFQAIRQIIWVTGEEIP